MEHMYKPKLELGLNVQDDFIELNKRIEMMENLDDNDYVLVPKYKLDQAKEIAISYMMGIGNKRRLEVIQMFCPICGGIEVPCKQPHA